MYNKRFYRFSVSIDNILREICLVEIVGTTLTICLLEYYFIMVKNFKNICDVKVEINDSSHTFISNCSLNIIYGYLIYSINALFPIL